MKRYRRVLCTAKSLERDAKRLAKKAGCKSVFHAYRDLGRGDFDGTILESELTCILFLLGANRRIRVK